MNGDTAILTSDNQYTSFFYGGKRIRFMTSPKLERYLKVNKWDHGYIEVVAKYHDSPPEEEYIDLVPILQRLYIDPEVFLRNIKKVEIRYE